MKLASMAWRNIWRNRRRTVITLSSIAFGVFLAVTMTGLNDWLWAKSIDDAARFGSGHVAVQHPDYLETPSLERTLRATPDLLGKIAGVAGVDRIVPRVIGQAVVATASDSFGVSFFAIDPKVDDKMTLSMIDKVVQGKMLTSAEEDGIVLGDKLAENLSVTLGKKVVYTLTNKDGDIVSGLARVRGIVDTGTGADASLCLLPLTTVRKLLGYADDEVTQISVYLGDQRNARDVARALQPVAAPAVAHTWAELSPDLDGFINVKVTGTNILEGFVILLIAAGIFNTLFVSVMERTREFGIMLAIGFAPMRLFALVIWESFWIGLVGLVVGAVVTAPFYYRWATAGLDLSAATKGQKQEVAGALIDPVFYMNLYWDHAVIISVCIVAATIAAGLLPAWRATRVEPVEAIRLV